MYQTNTTPPKSYLNYAISYAIKNRMSIFKIKKSDIVL